MGPPGKVLIVLMIESMYLVRRLVKFVFIFPNKNHHYTYMEVCVCETYIHVVQFSDATWRMVQTVRTHFLELGRPKF